MPRALFIASAFPRSDDDIITPWLVELILRLRARGVEVEVLVPSYHGLSKQTHQGIPVHRFRYAPRAWESLTHDQTAPDRIRECPLYAALLPGYAAAGSLAAARLAGSGRFDLIHAFWPLPHSLLGLAARQWSGLPLVSTFFGVELTWVERQLPFLRPLLRGLIKHSDAVTAISSHTASLVQRASPGCAPYVIPFSTTVDTARLEAGPSDLESSGPLRLLFVGRLVERKGVRHLLDALSLLPVNLASLDVVGDGPERASLERQVEAFGLSERVRFHGYVPAAALPEFLSRAEALVLPAVEDQKGDVEGLGVVLLEALAYAKPVIASRSGGIVDIVRHGETGLLTEPGNAMDVVRAITQLAEDRHAARAMGVRGREDVRARFSWDVILDDLVSLYDALPKRRRARRL